MTADIRTSRPAPSWPGLLVFIAITFTAAWLGSRMTTASLSDWYVALAKPPWTPPDRIFGPVWTILYLMMALAAWLVWQRGGWLANAGPLALWGLQLALNVLWTALFFGMRSPAAGLLVILLLWSVIFATLFNFWSRAPAAGVLMLPYLCWTTFATALNFAIWRLNA